MMQVRRTRATRRRPPRAAGVALGLLLSLGACSYVPNWASPVEWYRDVTGVAKNDNTGPERNQQNLEEGSKEPFPNLASVPPMPTNALSAAERQKLRDSLAADRENAHYLENSEQFTPTPPSAAISATSPQPEPAATPASSGTPASAAAAEPGPTPPTTPADVAPQAGPSVAAAPEPTPAPAPPAATPAPAPPAATPPAATAAADSAPTPAPSPSRPAATQAPARNSEALPAESAIAAPTVSSLPQGETPGPVPPAPPGIPTASSAPAPTQTAPAAAPPSAPPSVPGPVASAAPASAAAEAASPRTAREQRAPRPRPAATVPPVLASVPTAKLSLGTVDFVPNTTQVTEASNEQLRAAVRMREENGGGTLHVVAFTELGPGRDLATRSIAGFNLALDRARAVGIALTQLGVPASSVSIGAGPPPADRQPGTADISLDK